MRRVWYGYTISILAHRALLLGLVFGVSSMLFKELVFIERIVDNFLQTEVGQLPIQVWHIFIEADTPSLLAGAVMVTSIFLFFRLIIVMPASIPSRQVSVWCIE